MFNISVESTQPILKELTILNIQPSFNFLYELDFLNREVSKYKQIKKKVRKRLSGNPTKTKELNSWNETQKWIFDAESNRFEKIKNFCIKTASKDIKTGDIIYNNYEDFFMAWVTDLCKRNTLATKINSGEKINNSVLYWWYRQFIQRASMKSAQDAHSRVYGVRTQSEITHEKVHEHDLAYLDASGLQEAKVVHKFNEETGSVTGEPDYYVDEDPYQRLHLQSVHAFVKKVFLRSYGSIEKTENRYQLFLEILEGKGGYSNLEEWAESHGISINKLKKRISHIEALLSKHKDEI